MEENKKIIKIGNKLIGHQQPAFIVAEIGINHNGDINIAKQLIDIAVSAGCDAVKFQKRTIELVYSPEELARPRENPFGLTNGDLKRGLEFGEKEYHEIDRYCREKNIIWFASSWDVKSVDFLENFNVPCYKIASACLTDNELLRYIKSKNKPIILSTGMSSVQEIRNAVNILGEDNLILLHCTSTYPSDNKELNLNVIPWMKKTFICPIGWSGHSSGVTSALIAATLGACVVERHITLDRAMWGSDQAASLAPRGLSIVVRDIRNLQKCLGDGKKIVYESEKPIREKLRRAGSSKRKGKVLFIVHDVYQEGNRFPLGVAYLAAVLKKQGVDVKVCCQDIFHYSNDELSELFLKNQDCDYDLIGIGFLAARFRETILDLCATVNKFKKNAWLVLGGHGPSSIPEYVLEKTKADIVVIGEAEETIVELLKCKLENGDLSQIKGIAYQGKESVRINERRSPIIDLDSIPFPEWSLFPIQRYANCLELCGMDKDDKTLGIATSRGCVNRCNFCYRMEQSIRFRNIENIIEEIKFLKEKYGVTYFQMTDELFIFSKKRVFDFYQALRENNLKIKFSCNARVDIFDEEMAICLKESGCKFLNFGMESSKQNVLDLMKKNTTVEQNIQAAEIARKVGIGLGLNFIWGNKGDTEESLQNNVKLIKKYNTYDQIRTIRPVTPYPGSELYYEAIERGLLSGPEDFFNRFKNSDLFTVNFTDIPEQEFYKLLFDANKELITDYFIHTTKDMDKANKLIKDFYDLYFKGQIDFRGARDYSRAKLLKKYD